MLLSPSENRTAAKAVSRNLALMKPELDDQVQVLSVVSAGVFAKVSEGAGLKR